jgi:ribosomal protein S18 acetylase RimI-like enzyme
MENPIEIRLVSQWDSEEIVALYRAGGWWKEEYEPSGILPLIKGSFLFAVAIDSGKAIGMGRVLSDGISDGYIQDLVILPEYRRRGVGKMIISALLEGCKKRGLGWIALIAEPDSERFYHTLGFRRLEGYVPLIYERED